VINGDAPRCFIPIAVLHHAKRNMAAGFCVFNDAGILIEALRQVYGVKRIALGGGGYNRGNLATGWNAVLRQMCA